MSLYPNIPIGGSEKCHCKRGASYCVTVTGVTVSGEPCSTKSISMRRMEGQSHRGRGRVGAKSNFEVASPAYQ